MAGEAVADGGGVRKRRMMPLLIGLVLALVLGAGGFAATYLFLPGSGGGHDDHAAEGPAAISGIAFVPVDPLIISLGPAAGNRHLRFRAQLEVAEAQAAEVTLILPRIVDVLNSYLRAVDPAGLERPEALVRVRAQLLRRVQMVAGEGRVRDLLISEFVLN